MLNSNFSGFVKAVIGLSVTWVAIWGLTKIVPHPQAIHQYREADLRSRIVIHDETGWPIHPDSYRRNVHALSLYVLRLIIWNN